MGCACGHLTPGTAGSCSGEDQALLHRIAIAPLRTLRSLHPRTAKRCAVTHVACAVFPPRNGNVGGSKSTCHSVKSRESDHSCKSQARVGSRLATTAVSLAPHTRCVSFRGVGPDTPEQCHIPVSLWGQGALCPGAQAFHQVGLCLGRGGCCGCGKGLAIMGASVRPARWHRPAGDSQLRQVSGDAVPACSRHYGRGLISARGPCGAGEKGVVRGHNRWKPGIRTEDCALLPWTQRCYGH